MNKNKQIFYAKKRLNYLASEMGALTISSTQNSLSAELESGMSLQLHDEEIKHQAAEFLNEELSDLKKLI